MKMTSESIVERQKGADESIKQRCSMSLVKAEGAYSPQSYVLAVTGKCYIVDADTIEGLIEDIRGLVYLSGHELWDYPLSEIDHIVENQTSVVLVELTGEDGDGEWKTVYRWFEVPEDFGGTDLA